MCKMTRTRGCPESCRESGNLPLHEQSNPCLHGIIMNDDDDDDVCVCVSGYVFQFLKQ